MAVRTSSELKAFFLAGVKPTESQFSDLIDTMFAIAALAAGVGSNMRIKSGTMQIFDPVTNLWYTMTLDTSVTAGVIAPIFSDTGVPT